MKQGFETIMVHAGQGKDSQGGSLITPICQTSTFIFDNCDQGGRRFALEEEGYIYTRIGNPTCTGAEIKIAAMEGAEAAVGFASGMGAITAVLWTLCGAGSHLIADTTLYGSTFEYFDKGLKRFGVDVEYLDLRDIAALKKTLRKETAAVYFESPVNPNIKILDIKAISDETHRFDPNIKVIFDNTFATPYLQLPIKLGADVVVHSATKYLNGHADVIAGFACGTAEFMEKVRVLGIRDLTGAPMSPFEAFLVNRGMKTLSIRMDRQCDNAMALAQYLEKHPKVSLVLYPGLPSHPDHEIAKKQMSKFGAMIAFQVKGGKEAAKKLLDNLKICSLAVSLGGTETLVEHAASMTHSTYSPEDLAAAGIDEGLVRLSVGLETVEDLIADFEAAFKLI